MSVEEFGPILRTGIGADSPVSTALTRACRLHRITAGKLLKQTGLYPGQELVMGLLWESGAARQSDLIKAMRLDPSTVTKMLQRLEQAGHVTRVTDPADRRAVLVEATESSRALRHEIENAWTDLEDRTVAGLDDTERAELHRLLTKIGANLHHETADCP